MVRFPLGMWVDLKSQGCRKLNRGNTGGSMYVSAVARFIGVEPLLLLLCRCCMYCADAFFKFRGSVGWHCCPSLCSGWHAHKIRTHAHTETAHFLSVTKRTS